MMRTELYKQQVLSREMSSAVIKRYFFWSQNSFCYCILCIENFQSCERKTEKMENKTLKKIKRISSSKYSTLLPTNLKKWNYN